MSAEFQFGDWTIETSLNRITRADCEQHLEPKTMAVLVFLLDRHGEVVSVDEMLDRLWTGRIVGPNALHRHIALLRRALGDDPSTPSYIETITKRGYRTIASMIRLPPHGAAPSDDSQHDRQEADSWGTRIAVSPFLDRTTGKSHHHLVDGMAEEVVAGLASFSDIGVIPPSALPRGDASGWDPLDTCAAVGADFFLEGSVSDSASRVRVSLRLTDVANREVIWSRSFDYVLSASSYFDIQDDVKARVSAGIADSFGVVSSKAYERARTKPTSAIAADDAVMLAKGHEGNPKLHREAREGLEKAVEQHPDFANAWAWLGAMYRDEFVFWANERPNPLERAESAAQRALKLDASNQEALLVLADVRFYQGDLAAFRQASERAMSLNPSSPDLLSVVASHLIHAGYYEEGKPLAQRAVDLLAQPTLHMLGTLSVCHYGLGDYAAAARVIRQVWAGVDRNRISGMQAYYLTLLVAATAKLGREDEAGQYLQWILKSIPNYAQIMGPSWHRQGACEDLRERLAEGLAAAGLRIGELTNR